MRTLQQYSLSAVATQIVSLPPGAEPLAVVADSPLPDGGANIWLWVLAEGRPADGSGIWPRALHSRRVRLLLGGDEAPFDVGFFVGMADCGPAGIRACFIEPENINPMADDSKMKTIEL